MDTPDVKDTKIEGEKIDSELQLRQLKSRHEQTLNKILESLDVIYPFLSSALEHSGQSAPMFDYHVKQIQQAWSDICDTIHLALRKD